VKAGAKSFLSLNQNMETPLASPGIAGSASQESPTGLRGEDAGKSKGRSVMERIGSGNFSAISRQNHHMRKSQMNAERVACASSAAVEHWDHIDWKRCEQQVARLQARIVKASREGRWGKVKAL